MSRGWLENGNTRNGHYSKWAILNLDLSTYHKVDLSYLVPPQNALDELVPDWCYNRFANCSFEL